MNLYWKIRTSLAGQYHAAFRHVLKRSPQKRLILVAGCRRTGNHAIIQWLYRQSPGVVSFYNDLHPGTPPVHWPQMIDSPLGNLFMRVPPAAEPVNRRTLICSYEEKPLARIVDAANLQGIEAQLGPWQDCFHVLLLRDAWNLFASRMNLFGLKSRVSGAELERILLDVKERWKEMARIFAQDGPAPWICVSYNRWVSERPYRQALAQRLGIPFTDAGKNRVASYGGGSSFQPGATAGAAGLEVFQRWQRAADHPVYRRVLADRELLALNQHIFGEIPGTASLQQTLWAEAGP